MKKFFKTLTRGHILIYLELESQEMGIFARHVSELYDPYYLVTEVSCRASLTMLRT